MKSRIEGLIVKEKAVSSVSGFESEDYCFNYRDSPRLLKKLVVRHLRLISVCTTTAH